MNIWKIEDIYRALKLKNYDCRETTFSGISIDTRTIKKGELYIPLKGKNFDGHDFIKEAFEKGACASLTQEKIRKSSKNPELLIHVRDTSESLSRIAEFSRRRIKNLIVISITGSSGKTTLKDWVFHVFKDFKKTYCTPGNLNNEIGMPLTLSNMPCDTELCILELGMNTPGEIKRLSKIAKPDIAIITNIGSAHSGNFKKVESIANEKSEIFSYLDRNSSAIIPFESEYHQLIFNKASKKTQKVYSFGYHKDCEIKILEEDNLLKNFSILNEEVKIKKKTSFANWDVNVSIILGLAKILKIKIQKIIPKIINLSPISGRGKVTKISYKSKLFTLIDESYNSNPESLIRAIENLNNKEFIKLRKICIIGDMLELGGVSKKKHVSMVKTLAKIRPEIVITVGNYSKLIYDNLPGDFLKIHYQDYKNVFKKLLGIIKNKDVIMIKGSNSINLHLVSEKLIKLG